MNEHFLKAKNQLIWLKLSVEKLLDKVFESRITHMLSIYLISTLVFYIFSDKINILIERYFTINKNSLFKIHGSLFFIISGIMLVFIIHKLIIKRYQPSSIMTHSIFTCSILYVITRFTSYKQGWSFIPFSNGSLAYVDFFGVLIVFGVFIIIVLKIKGKKSRIETNIFVSDDPIISESEDRLEYEKRASHIISYIKKAQFNNSFTIGVVGPWGNGKSSFLSLIEGKLEKENLKDTIHLKFLPYLNHNEKEIISEFFKQLSSEINKYSGKLSNEFITYSDKLLKLYKSKNIIEFLKPNTNQTNDISVYDSYVKINKTLESLDKKYIIFIDELDRLSNNEVLQILKLVRNTANFKNFIFLIALDKDYVLETLTTKNDIVDHSFVNKFFQLEIYLPEINKSQLKSDFIALLQQSILNQHQSFIIEISTSIYKKENLFDDYIANYRDVKRLVNQLIFDYDLLPDKLNTNDFLNFTYLKMTFPFAIKYLNQNWQSLIPYNPDSKLCELKEYKKGENKPDIIEKIRMITTSQNNDPDYTKYEISSNLQKPKDISQITKFTYSQNLLLSKTLIYLFGKENSDVGHTSIKFENNFRKLIQQKILETDLDENSFNTIFDFENDFENLKTILANNQSDEILNRIAYLNSNNQERVEKVIIVLLYIFDKSTQFNIVAYSAWDILVKFIDRSIKFVEIDKSLLWKNIFDNFLEDDNFKKENKIQLFSLISEHRIRLSFDDWGTDEKTLKKLSLQLYHEYLNEMQGKHWDVNDYSFYRVYHSVKKLNTAEDINPLFIDFWEDEKNNIELLCAQITGPEPFTLKKFKTSDLAHDLFGSKEEYYWYMTLKHQNSGNKSIREYLEFIGIERITNFSEAVRFEFIEFDLMKNKIKHLKSHEPNNFLYDEHENEVEIILKTSSEFLGSIMQTDLNFKKINGLNSHNSYFFEKESYLFLRIKTGFYHQAKIALFNHYKEKLKGNNMLSIISSDNDMITILESDEFIKIHSIQPKSYDK